METRCSPTFLGSRAQSPYRPILFVLAAARRGSLQGTHRFGSSPADFADLMELFFGNQGIRYTYINKLGEGAENTLRKKVETP